MALRLGWPCQDWALRVGHTLQSPDLDFGDLKPGVQKPALQVGALSLSLFPHAGSRQFRSVTLLGYKAFVKIVLPPIRTEDSSPSLLQSIRIQLRSCLAEGEPGLWSVERREPRAGR